MNLVTPGVGGWGTGRVMSQLYSDGRRDSFELRAS